MWELCEQEGGVGRCIISTCRVGNTDVSAKSLGKRGRGDRPLIAGRNSLPRKAIGIMNVSMDSSYGETWW